jgi:hypothetical protein
MPSPKLLHMYTVSFSRKQGAPASLLTAHVAVNLQVWNAAAWMDRMQRKHRKDKQDMLSPERLGEALLQALVACCPALHELHV